MFKRLMRRNKAPKTLTFHYAYLKPLGQMTRVNFSVRGDCSFCALKDVPCQHYPLAADAADWERALLGDLLVCASCTMTGRPMTYAV
jgi:hypothetical protein